jgi:hydrogenase nickel incorporation protein HypA/HybF
MHETGIAEGIIEALRQVQAERKDPIQVVRLQVGELSGISPEHLAEHFYEAAEGTEFEHVTLETEVRGIMGKCTACEVVFEITDEVDACPECGSRNVSVQADDGLKLVAVE